MVERVANSNLKNGDTPSPDQFYFPVGTKESSVAGFLVDNKLGGQTAITFDSESIHINHDNPSLKVVVDEKGVISAVSLRVDANLQSEQREVLQQRDGEFYLVFKKSDNDRFVPSNEPISSEAIDAETFFPTGSSKGPDYLDLAITGIDNVVLPEGVGCVKNLQAFSASGRKSEIYFSL